MTLPMRLGILTWRKGAYVEEITFFTHLAKEALQMNTQVFIFSPGDVRDGGKISGLVYQQGKGWTPQISPFPHIVYDRFRNMNPTAFRQFVQFRDQCKLNFLNSRLAHKWNLYRYLQGNPTLAKWLPETLFLHEAQDVHELLKKYPTVYVKPVNGTGGKGILAVSRLAMNQFQLLGRNSQRKKIKTKVSSLSSLSNFVSNWTKETKYIVQQGLNLEWEAGLITDFRLLVQKNGSGNWTITGMGGKIGPKNSATSNLHSGGKAVQPASFLRRHFSEEKCRSLQQECAELGLETARYIEEKFGRLVELGIDLGIDKEGRVWMIEVNNKPGRDIFRQMGELETYRKAVRRPIEYARYLYERKGES